MPRKEARWLAAILAVGLGLRLWHVLALKATPWFDTLDIDPAYYDAWARRIAGGDWLGDKPFFMEPGYPYFLGVLYAAFGRSLLLVRVLQAAIGTGTVLFTALTARRLFGPRAGLTAAVLAATFLPSVFYEGEIEKTFLAVFFVALATWAYFVPKPLGAGVALAFASLARGNLVAMLPLGALPLPRWRPAVLFVLGGTLVLFPVWLRNSALAGAPTVSSTHGGQNFFLGNWRGNVRGGYEAPPWLRPNPEWEQADFRAEAEARAHRSLDDGEVSRFWFRKGLSEIAADVPRWLTLMQRKLRLFFSDYEVPDNQDFYFLGRWSTVLTLPLPTFGWLLPLAALGLVAHRTRREVRVLAAFVALYCASVVAFFVFARYRVQVVPALTVLAAGGATWAVERWKERDTKALRGPLLAAAAALGVAFAPLHGFERDSGLAQSFTNLGALYVHRGEPQRALEAYAEALKVAPGHDRTYRDRGVLLASLGRVAEAHASLERCVQLNPNNAECWMHLAKLFDGAGRLDEARAAYARTLEKNPGNAEAAFNLASIAQKQGRYADAVELYRRMLQTLPAEARVHHNLALALLALGRLDEAKAEGARSAELGLQLPEPVRAQLGL